MLTITKILNDKELKYFANEMKMTAVQRKIEGGENEENYAQNEEEAKEFYDNDEHRQWIESAPHIQPIFLNDEIINLVLTVEILGDKERWHLSMSRMVLGENKPQKVSDSQSSCILQAFFPDEYEEIPTKSVVYPNIRDFISPKVK